MTGYRMLKRGESTRMVRERFMESLNVVEAEPKAAPEPVIPKDQCPKCGKRIGRGRFIHIKNCKGV